MTDNETQNTPGPVPETLAGFQHIWHGEVRHGDVLVFGTVRQWANGSVGASISPETGTTGGGARVYRKLETPGHEGKTRVELLAPHYSAAKPEETHAALSDLVHRVNAVTLKDSGARRDFGTGSVRDMATGKGCPHLAPLRAFTLLEQQMERGMQKYGARNWELGQPLSSYFDSATRHLRKHWLGYTDEPHLAAFLWNAACYAETAERIRLGVLPKNLDDRPELGRATAAEMEGRS